MGLGAAERATDQRGLVEFEPPGGWSSDASPRQVQGQALAIQGREGMGATVDRQPTGDRGI